MSEPKIKIKLLNSLAKMPTRADNGAAGYDIYASEYAILRPFERKVIKTGISIEIPPGYYGRIAPRSGLAVKNGIDVMAGVIDSSYRNEVGVVLINLAIIGSQMNPDLLTIMTGGANDFRINAGDRIAQLIIEKYYPFDFEEVDNLSESDRTGGFGSTGMR